jgi:hypothetical protein
LLYSLSVDRGVLATASELFEARHYPGVVALISDALQEDPDSVPLLLVRARAHIALRRDLEAQADLRDIIRLDPQCSSAYRMLGELAARRNENESAAIFFREALRLDPNDIEAETWLAVVEVKHTSRPAAVAQKLPAPAAAAGRFPSAEPRFAKGTRSPDDEPTDQFRAAPSRSSRREDSQSRIPTARRREDSQSRITTARGEDSQPGIKRPQRPLERPVAKAGPDIKTDREIEALPPPPAVPFAGGSSPELEAFRTGGQPTAKPQPVARVALVKQPAQSAASQTQQRTITRHTIPRHQVVTQQPIAQPRHANVFQAYPAETHEHKAADVMGEIEITERSERTSAHSTVERTTGHRTNLAARGDDYRGHVEHAGYRREFTPPCQEPERPGLWARGSEPEVPAIAPHQPTLALRLEPASVEQQTLQGAQPVRRPLSQPGPSSLSSPASHARGPLPELPGFDEYLVSTGILTRERLRAAQAYQRSMRVQLATAIVTLGLATPQRIEWAVVAHQSLIGRSGERG